MKRREEFFKEIEDFENEKLNNLVKDYIDDIEYEVNEAKFKLESIKNVKDLIFVEDCLSALEDLSRDLY
jgi:hypothetical protein